MSVFLGIDPGSRVTGYGVLELRQKTPYYHASGCIRTSGGDISHRLQTIFSGIVTVCQRHQPQHAAIEQVFMHRNAQSALKLGQARGAAISAMTYCGLVVDEYSAKQVKQSVVGYGAAAKVQIQHMMKQLLSLSEQPASDAADALAIAYCHIHHCLTQQAFNLKAVVKIEEKR